MNKQPESSSVVQSLHCLHGNILDICPKCTDPSGSLGAAGEWTAKKVGNSNEWVLVSDNDLAIPGSGFHTKGVAKAIEHYHNLSLSQLRADTNFARVQELAHELCLLQSVLGLIGVPVGLTAKAHFLSLLARRLGEAP